MTTCLLVVAVSSSVLGLSSCTKAMPVPTDRISVSGLVEADETRIGVLFPGKVTFVGTKEGDSVNQGDLLLRLDSGMFDKQLQSVEELILQAESERKGISQLIAKLKIPTGSGLPTKAIAAVSTLNKTTRSGIVDNQSNVGIAKSDTDEKFRNYEVTEQLKQIEEAQAAQLQILHEATAKVLATLDGAHSQEQLMLKEGREEAKRNAKSKLTLSPITKSKLAGIDEVFDAKGKALDQAYEAQRQAILESSASKESTIKESIESKISSVRQLQSAKKLIVDEFSSERAKIQASLEKQKEQLQARIGIESGAQAEAALQKIGEMALKNQRQALKLQAEQAHVRLSMLDTELIKARAMRTELKGKIDLCSVKSPVTGVCVARSVQPGELVTPGPTLLKLADLNALYVRALVPEGDLASLRLGQIAEIHLDSTSSKPILAKVVAIASSPCFTPKGVYFKEDRVKEAFAIRLAITEHSSAAKPGMPVDATIFFAGKGND